MVEKAIRTHLKARNGSLKVARTVGFGPAPFSVSRGRWSDNGGGGVTVVDTVGKDNGADRLGMAVRTKDSLPTTTAIPFTPGYHRSRTFGAAG
jgi:hypothetical protein